MFAEERWVLNLLTTVIPTKTTMTRIPQQSQLSPPFKNEGTFNVPWETPDLQVLPLQLTMDRMKVWKWTCVA